MTDLFHTRQLFWQSLAAAAPGMEHLRLLATGGQVTADGMVLGMAGGRAFRFQYLVQTDASYQVQMVRLHVQSAAKRPLELAYDGQGGWIDGTGRQLAALDGCTELDIEATPFTNTLPIRRLGLKPGESAEILAAYASIPALELRPERQRYTCLEQSADTQRYQFETPASDFSAELLVDNNGLVIEYPGLFRRLWVGN